MRALSCDHDRSQRVFIGRKAVIIQLFHFLNIFCFIGNDFCPKHKTIIPCYNGSMPLQIIRNNIADVKADMIVCPCNKDPMSIGGAQKAIYDAAGTELFRARIEIGQMHTTEVQVTPAFHLKARYVLHCCGPVYTDGNHCFFLLCMDGSN